MNPIEFFKLMGLWQQAQKIAKEKAPMNVKVAHYLTLFCTLSGTFGLPTLATSWVHQHLYVYMSLVAAAMVLHAIFPSVFAAPSAADKQATGLTT